MQHRFFALISRMRYIGRWGLMRNTFEENIQEHSHMVAVLAHALGLISRDIYGNTGILFASGEQPGPEYRNMGW